MTETYPPTLGTAPISSAPYSAPAAATSERMLLLSPRLSDLATLVASSEVSTAAVANLQSVQPREKWRTNSSTEANITITTTVPVAADTLALVGHNLSAMGVLRLRGAVASADLTSDPDIDTGWVSAWPSTGKPTIASWPQWTSLVRWDAAGEMQYWRLDLADPDATLTYLEAGRLVLGAAWQPSLNFDLGGTPLGFEVSDVQSKSTYGGLFPDRRTTSPPRIFELTSYAWDRREAFDGLSEIQRLRGGWGDVICCLDPGETTDFHRYTMQGAFTLGGAYTAPPAFNSNGQMFGAAIRLREFI